MSFSRLQVEFGKFVQGMAYRQKIMSVILLFTLIPFLLTSAVTFIQYKESKTAEYLNAHKAGFEKAAQGVNDLYYSSMMKSAYLNNNLQIIQMLRQDYSFDLVSYISNIHNVAGIIDALRSDRLNHEIRLFSFNESVYANDNIRKIGQLDPHIAEAVLKREQNSLLWRFSPDQSGSAFYMSIYNKMMDISRPLAVTEVRIPYESISSTLRYPIPDHSFIAYTTRGGEYVPVHLNNVKRSEADEAVARFLKEGEGTAFYVIPVDIQLSGDRVLLFIDRNDIGKTFMKLLAATVAAIVGLIVILYFSVRAVSVFLTSRLTKLMKKINVESDSEEEPMQAELWARNDEFANIDRKFSELVQRIKHYYRSTKDYEVEKEKLEMEILQVGINPHFLYNTLSAIKWTYSDEKLNKLIDDMVGYYRVFLSKGDKVLPISTELGMIRKYLDIQKFAYSSDFQYEIHMEEQIGDYPMLKNLLQPIIENSILHGINGLESGGLLVVTASRSDRGVTFAVEDNGVGMKREVMEQILIGPGGGKPGLGYGLSNVQARLRLYYGAGHGLTIESEPDLGTKVTFTIPASKP